MAYYNYHARNMERIKAGELTGYEYVKEYNGIAPAMLLHFLTKPHIRPIRAHKFNDYEKLFSNKKQSI